METTPPLGQGLGRAWAGWVALWCCWGRFWGNGAFWEISRPVGAVALEKTIEGLGRFRGRCYYIFGENLRFVWKYWEKLIPGGFYPNRMGVKSQLWKWWLLGDVDWRSPLASFCPQENSAGRSRAGVKNPWRSKLMSICFNPMVYSRKSCDGFLSPFFLLKSS